MREISLTLLVLIVSASLTRGDYSSDEANLISLLRSNTSVDVRPDYTTIVHSGVVLFALNTVDIESEVMSLSGLLVSQWRDRRLAWDPKSNGIFKIVVNTKYVWIPPLVIENEVNKIGVLGADNTPLRVIYTGDVVWSPPISTTTSCSADITYYPYDKQTCSVTLIGWSYTVAEVDVQVHPENAIDLTYFVKNGEWDYLSSGYYLLNLTDTELGTFRKIKFNLVFRRKWPYYGQNIILPIVLNAILMPMVFIVPVESGEKMGYCLTVLLSFIVLLTMVSNNLPAISSQTSLVQMYLSIVLSIGTAIVICTIGVLRVYNHDPQKPIPGWLQKLTKYILEPLVCQGCKSKKTVYPEHKPKEHYAQTVDHTGQQIALILDRVFFRLFACILLVLTVGVLAALFKGYHN